MKHKDMSVLREAPSFKSLAERTKTGGWRLPMRDYTLDGVVSIEGNIEKLGHQFYLYIDEERELVQVAPFSQAIDDLMRGQPYVVGSLRLARISQADNPDAHSQTMCNLTIGRKSAILDIEELLSYTRLV